MAQQERRIDKSRRGGWLLRAALAVALAAPVLVVLGAVGTKLGLWDWRFGFGTMTVNWAPKAAMAGLAAVLLAAVMTAVLAGWRGAARRWPLILAGLLIPAATLGGFAQLRAKAQSVPPIHDYATDWREPLTPTPQLLSVRGPDANPIEADPRTEALRDRPGGENWADDRIGRIGSEACPQARPVMLQDAPAQAQDRVRRALEEEGLVVVTEAPGRLEATHTSFWYGFKDDVLVRIRPEGGGSQVDLRSVSRVGQSDLGANCERISELGEALQG